MKSLFDDSKSREWFISRAGRRTNFVEIGQRHLDERSDILSRPKIFLRRLHPLFETNHRSASKKMLFPLSLRIVRLARDFC